MSNSLEGLAPILDAEKVADLLKCSPYTVVERARTGELPAAKFGDGWIFPTEALLARVNEIALEKSEALRGVRKGATARVVNTRQGRKAPPALPAIDGYAARA